MRSTDDIRRLFKKAELRIHPDADEQVFKDVLRARQKMTENLPALPESTWRVIMKSPLAKLAAAALVLIACFIGVSLWTGTQSGIALADVLDQIEKVKVFRCQWSEEGTGEGPNKPQSYRKRCTLLISREYGWKMDWEELDPNGGQRTSQLYIPADRRTMTCIMHEQRKYWRTEFDSLAAEEWSNFDPRASLKKILACKYESMGRSTIDGIEVEGFQTTDPNYVGRGFKNTKVDVRIWVDVKTRLPVRYEGLTGADFYLKGNKIIWRYHLVIHDFRWDVAIDASEFKPVIPDDYTGVVIKYPEHITEETAIQGLKLCAELLGNYPDPESIRNYFPDLRSALEKSETPAALRLKEELKGLSEDDKIQRLSDVTLPINCLVRFYIALQRDNKDPAHYGKTVTPKDADKVLMRWKVSDNEYRVIFGDLHAESVSSERLAQLEGAMLR